MKRVLLVLAVCCVCASACAQEKSARSYYEEAKQAGALPPLPYVCFRDTFQLSTASGSELPDSDPTFAMLGTSQQVAEAMQRKAHDQMSSGEREQVQRLRNDHWLYIEVFDRGIHDDSHILALQNPKDPSRADWVFQGYGRQKKPLKWDFHINWDTLHFKETITTDSDSVTYLGHCEEVTR